MPKTTKSLQITENKALGGKHNVGDKLDKAKNEVRFSWEGDLRGRATEYFTIYLYLIKVNKALQMLLEYSKGVAYNVRLRLSTNCTGSFL